MWIIITSSASALSRAGRARRKRLRANKKEGGLHEKNQCSGAVGRYTLLTYGRFRAVSAVLDGTDHLKSDAQMYNTTFLFTPTLDNYIQVLTGSDYLQCFFDNIIVSAGAVLVAVVFGVPAAYAAGPL
jgi:ABC-type glycerol-3-phosphate transport system permease component